MTTPAIPEEPETAVQRQGVTNTIVPNTSTMIEEGPDEDDEDDEAPPTPPQISPVPKTFQQNTIIPNTSIMIEDSAGEEEEEEEEEEEDDRRPRVPSTVAASSTKSLSPPVFKSATFAKALQAANGNTQMSNVNGFRKTRSISPPPALPKPVIDIVDISVREREWQEKVDEYEDKIEALKERITELQDELKIVKEELNIEQTKPPSVVVKTGDEKRERELEDEIERLKEELREQQEVWPLTVLFKEFSKISLILTLGHE
jgi:hypothetical protein